MDTNTLKHHGIVGMKWGVRRFQNKDGSLTSAGRKRAIKNDAYKNKGINKVNNIIDKSTSTLKQDIRNKNNVEKLGKAKYESMTKSVGGNYEQTISYLSKRIEVGQKILTSAQITKNKISEIDSNSSKYKDVVKKVDTLLAANNDYGLKTIKNAGSRNK